ncbi:MAG: hypothetical protein BroJett025_09730 [Patescibacteria group bacterium]|nr:MAG: hypothetical protein BroJett025_09730 [Patescibacteria group bacterium]
MAGAETGTQQAALQQAEEQAQKLLAQLAEVEGVPLNDLKQRAGVGAEEKTAKHAEIEEAQPEPVVVAEKTGEKQEVVKEESAQPAAQNQALELPKYSVKRAIDGILALEEEAAFLAWLNTASNDEVQAFFQPLTNHNLDLFKPELVAAEIIRLRGDGKKFSSFEDIRKVTNKQKNVVVGSGTLKHIARAAKRLLSTSAAEPATAEPATAEPATAEPATAEPATAEPATAEPATAEPATAEPATAEPATAEPATAEPATAEPATAEPATAEPTAEPATAEAALEKVTTWEGFLQLATSEKYKSLFNQAKLASIQKEVGIQLSWLEKQDTSKKETQDNFKDSLLGMFRSGMGEIFAGKTGYGNHKPNNEKLFDNFVRELMGLPVVEVVVTEKAKANTRLGALSGALRSGLSKVGEVFSRGKKEIVQDAPEWIEFIGLAMQPDYKDLFSQKKLQKNKEAILQLLGQKDLTSSQLGLALMGKGMDSTVYLREKGKFIKFFKEFNELFRKLPTAPEATAPGPIAAPVEGTAATVGTATTPEEPEVPAKEPAKEKYVVSSGYNEALQKLKEAPVEAANLALFQEELSKAAAEIKAGDEYKDRNESITEALKKVGDHMAIYLVKMALRGVRIDLGESEKAKYVTDSKDGFLKLVTETGDYLSSTLRDAFAKAMAENKPIEMVGDLIDDKDRQILKDSVIGLQISLVDLVEKAKGNAALEKEIKDEMVPAFRKLVTVVMSLGIKVV